MNDLPAQEAPYVYVITRHDLPPPQQLVQACHACAEAARYLPNPPPGVVPNLVACSVESEQALMDFL